MASPSPQPASQAAIVWVSKSTWEPAIRREHAFARLAARHGHDAWFLERQQDIRALLSGERRGQWLRALAGRHRVERFEEVRVVPTAALVPGHRSRAAERSAVTLLRRDLRWVWRRSSPDALVVGTPWLWPAASSIAGARRVLDVADDWRALLPKRSAHMDELYRRAGHEADAVILVSDALRELFPAEKVTVIPNGAGDDVLATPVTEPPRDRRMVYVGTLSPRFDAKLVAGVLDRLRDWSIDLWGSCQYPGLGDRPDAELQRLLGTFRGRAAWHGVVPRERVAAVIDAADVALLPNRTDLTAGQDSMKAYDYAARGRPIVAATAGGPDQVAAAVVAAATEAPALAAQRRAWAESQRWETRWPAWRAAVLGGG